MKINVHIRDEMFVIHCGDGNQPIEWLGNTACHRYDSHYLWDAGHVEFLRLQNGVHINMRGIINEELQDDVHVFVRLLGKYFLSFNSNTFITFIIFLFLEDSLAEERQDPGKN